MKEQNYSVLNAGKSKFSLDFLLPSTKPVRKVTFGQPDVCIILAFVFLPQQLAFFKSS